MSLRERREIVALANSGAAARPDAFATPGVLVTLVRAAGSTYRLPGARLLALPDGTTAGTISGGCLEADLLRKAHWRVRTGAVMQTYDTAFEDTAEVPFGLGCGGAVDLLLESLDTPEARALLQAMQATLQGEARTVIHRLPQGGPAFARIVMDRHGEILFASEDLPAGQIEQFRRVALPGGSPHGTASNGTSPSSVFVEKLLPAQRLVIFGAGDDARPLVRIAAEMGWTVIVADGRPQQARAERFPAATQVMVAESVAAARVTAQDAVVVMTHSYDQDRRVVTELLPISPRYLGLLGARHRSALLLQEASAAAQFTLREALDRVHAPIGLELGGDGPEKIALAIASEIQHALHAPPAHAGQSVGNRRMLLSQAHALLQQFGSALPVQTACALDRPAQADGSGEGDPGAWDVSKRSVSTHSTQPAPVSR